MCGPSNEGSTFEPDMLTNEECAALIKACSGRSPTGIRNASMLALFIATGLRCEELLSLSHGNINTKEFAIKVENGKRHPSKRDKETGKLIKSPRNPRTVGFSPGVMAHLQRWIDTKNTRGIKGSVLFCTLSGGRLFSAYVRAMITRMGERAGIGRRVHPHMLRHTFAVGLASAGTPMNKISGQLGHASVATTERYIRHLHPQEVIDAVTEANVGPWDQF